MKTKLILLVNNGAELELDIDDGNPSGGDTRHFIDGTQFMQKDCVTFFELIQDLVNSFERCTCPVQLTRSE